MYGQMLVFWSFFLLQMLRIWYARPLGWILGHCMNLIHKSQH
jgi:hypothetical protein